MEELIREINRCAEKLKMHMKNSELTELGETNDNTLKCDSFDSGSKASSGYDGEDSNDDELKCNRRLIFYENEPDGDDLRAISDDKDFNAICDHTDSDFSEIDSIYSYMLNKKFLKHVFLLPLYPPSKEIKIAYGLNFTTKSLHENHAEIIQKFLTDSKLNPDNIHIVYKMLLEMEDITCMSDYVPLAQKDVILNATNKDRTYWISLKGCPNIDDIVTPLIDEVVLVPKASSRISEVIPLKYKTDLLLPHEHEDIQSDLFRRRIATVQKISKDRAYFRIRRDEHMSETQKDLLLTKKYDIIFRSPRYPVRYQHHAIDLLSIKSEIRKYLFPTENPNKELLPQPQLKLSLFNKTIASNPEQLNAVNYITEGINPYAPFVIFGPPGTGKTTITVESILQLRLHNPENRILVTAGSNSACDTIALRICQYFNSNYRLRQLEKNDRKNQKSIIRIYSKSVVKKGIQLIDSELLEYSNCKNNHHHYPPVEEIRQYGIIVATLCTVGKLVLCDVAKLNFFTHIFMDEAGSSAIPEALVGVMEIKSNADCRLILSGDHKQLGPIIKSDRAAQLGLDYSLMELLLTSQCYAVDDNFNYDHTLQARLRRNYRSHPEIVKLYNNLYYNDELIAEAKEEDVNLAAKWCKLPNPKYPIIFQAVHGVTEKNNISPSSFNNLEVQVVMWFLQRLLIDGINGEKVKETDIGIITPYKLQIDRIQKRLNDRGWSKVESGSVETFQGREKQIIIVSLVKSFAGLGFLSNPKRLNVLLSRPKSLLILIGNPLTLRRHSDFAFIMDECKRHGTFMRKKKTLKYKKNLAVKATLTNFLSLSKNNNFIAL